MGDLQQLDKLNKRLRRMDLISFSPIVYSHKRSQSAGPRIADGTSFSAFTNGERD